jgi:hypothetical protein
LVPDILGNMPSSIVTKPPKPGFVGFGSTYLGGYQKFLGDYFSVLREKRPFIEGVFFFGQPQSLQLGSEGE